MTVPAGHFHPTQAVSNWHNGGYSLTLTSGAVLFTAPVVFPGSGPVTVKKVILYAYDNNSEANTSVTLYKTNPLAGDENGMSVVQSALHSSTDPRVFSDNTITYATIQRSHGAYLWLSINGTNITVYGVKIAYVD